MWGLRFVTFLASMRMLPPGNQLGIEIKGHVNGSLRSTAGNSEFDDCDEFSAHANNNFRTPAKTNTWHILC